VPCLVRTVRVRVASHDTQFVFQESWTLLGLKFLNPDSNWSLITGITSTSGHQVPEPPGVGNGWLTKLSGKFSLNQPLNAVARAPSKDAHKSRHFQVTGIAALLFNTIHTRRLIIGQHSQTWLCRGVRSGLIPMITAFMRDSLMSRTSQSPPARPPATASSPREGLLVLLLVEHVILWHVLLTDISSGIS
jgi:hypothetical protein